MKQRSQQSTLQRSPILGRLGVVFAIGGMDSLGIFADVYPIARTTYPPLSAAPYRATGKTYFWIEQSTLKLRNNISRGGFHPTDTNKNTQEENNITRDGPLAKVGEASGN